MEDATARPTTKRQRLVEEFEHQGAEGRRTLETISCSICAEPFEDPVSLRDSGHTYCRVCITQALANHARCPLSNAPIAVPRGGVDSVLVPNHQVRTLIDSQRVACRYASCGCAARPEVGAADAHEASCLHAPLKCSRCPFLGSRAETEEHMRSCPYVVLAPVLDAQASRIQSLERRVTEQDRMNERLAARLDALERSTRTVTPASAHRPPREASDLVFAKTRNHVELSMGGKMATSSATGSGCAISSEILRSGTNSWEIRLTQTDGQVGIGVCTERDGFCLDIADRKWCRGVMNGGRWVISSMNRVADADARWCDGDSRMSGSVLVVTFDCGTGKLSVGRKDGLLLRSASHVFGELASTPVAPFVFLTSGNTCEIAPYSPSRKRDRSRSPSSSRSPSPFIRRSGLGRTHTERRSRLDDVTFGDEGPTRESAAARASDRRRAVVARLPAGGRGVHRWAGAQPASDDSPPARPARRVRPPPPPSSSSSSDDEPLSALPVGRRPVVARRLARRGR
jgi:hypothetical protein